MFGQGTQYLSTGLAMASWLSHCHEWDVKYLSSILKKDTYP